MEGEGRGGGEREGKGREIKTPLLNGLPTGLIRMHLWVCDDTGHHNYALSYSDYNSADIYMYMHNVVYNEFNICNFSVLLC